MKPAKHLQVTSLQRHSPRRFRSLAPFAAEWWFARYDRRGNKGGIGQSPATAGAPRRPCFPFSPLARRTIPQATIGAGGISVSQGLDVTVASICEDADASILLHPPRQIPPKIHLLHPMHARLRLSSFFTILQFLFQKTQLLYRKIPFLYI